jgi:alpha-tubulin suppressor-like RCC1 family protein
VALLGKGVFLWAGGNQSCALEDTGIVRCWGDNLYGQIGLDQQVAFGDEGFEASMLPEILLDSPPKALVHWGMGKQHTCAFFAPLGVKCWGRNNYGQLGIGALIPNTVQAPVKSEISNIGLGSVDVVGTGANHTCVFSKDSGMRCWGRNQGAQLGLGNTQDYGLDGSSLGQNLPKVLLVSDTW